jgi:hypothetical protein
VGNVLAGARLFDDGHFFEAHERWEEDWRNEPNDERRLLLQGLIQVAAGLHKLLVKAAPDSAQRLLAKGLAKLDACPHESMIIATPEITIDLVAFRDRLRTYADALAAGRIDLSVPKLCDPAPG